MRMCDIFLRRGIAEPLGPALKRLRTGPFSTRARFTVRVSDARLLLFSAFAMALLSVLTIRRADLRGISVRYSTASLARRPWIVRATSRTFFGDMRALRVRACTSMVRASSDFLAGHSAVGLEDPGGGELAELVADHVLRDVHGDEQLAVVDVEGVADEVRRDGRAARPRLDRFARAGLDRLLDLLEQVVVDEEAFLDGTCHGVGREGLLLAARRPAVVAHEDEIAGQEGAPAGREPLGELAPRGDDLLAAAAALRLALAAAVRVVDGVHRHAAHAGPAPEPAVAPRLAERGVGLVAVADDADGRAALCVHQPDLAGGQLQLGLAVLDRHELYAHAGRAAHLGALAGHHLHAVDPGGRRNGAQGEAVAGREVVRRRRV